MHNSQAAEHCNSNPEPHQTLLGLGQVHFPPSLCLEYCSACLFIYFFLLSSTTSKQFSYIQGIPTFQNMCSLSLEKIKMPAACFPKLSCFQPHAYGLSQQIRSRCPRFLAGMRSGGKWVLQALLKAVAVAGLHEDGRP